MNMNQILKDLSPEQRKQEKALRAELNKDLKTHRMTTREIARRLVQLHDELVGEKNFKDYVECLGIPRRTAYRWMQAYRMLSSLPETVIRAADKRKMDLGSEKYQDVVKAIPCPESPTPAEADAWLESIVSHQKDSARKAGQAPDPAELQPDQRNHLTSETCSKHCKQLRSFVATYWPEVPAEERSIEVAQIVMGVTAAKLGIKKPFTVIPNARPEETDRLVERLEEKTAQEEVEEEVAA